MTICPSSVITSMSSSVGFCSGSEYFGASYTEGEFIALRNRTCGAYNIPCISTFIIKSPFIISLSSI